MVSYLIHSKTYQLILTTTTISLLVIAVSSSFSLISNNGAFAVTSQKQQQEDQSNINAASLFNTGTVVLPSNIKNLIITILDEAHHAPNAVPPKRILIKLIYHKMPLLIQEPL